MEFTSLLPVSVHSPRVTRHILVPSSFSKSLQPTRVQRQEQRRHPTLGLHSPIGSSYHQRESSSRSLHSACPLENKCTFSLTLRCHYGFQGEPRRQGLPAPLAGPVTRFEPLKAGLGHAKIVQRLWRQGATSWRTGESAGSSSGRRSIALMRGCGFLIASSRRG